MPCNQVISPCKNKYSFDLNLERYRGSEFQNQLFYLHFLTDTSSPGDFGRNAHRSTR